MRELLPALTPLIEAALAEDAAALVTAAALIPPGFCCFSDIMIPAERRFTRRA
ncbi:MAG: hypothetical protein HY687_02465 [Chloroflexi bacterium]|nr:hypothetical protein [Chloroflexota bacterium]